MAVRSLVSKKKVRFTEDGFDLDLTYVTPRVIAMGAPSQGGEALYRNPLPEVQRFFESRHPGAYKLYDLRAEPGAAYDPKLFDDRVAGRYRFFDHNPAPLALIRACVEDMHAWLQADTGNVVAVHCKAGKGRTGMIIACYLVYAGICKTAAEALRFFGDVRTLDGKGVTIPSQMRYVHYFEHSLYRPVAPAAYRLLHVRLHSVPNFDVEGGCDPYFDVRLGDGRHCVFDYKQEVKGKLKHYYPKHKIIDLDLTKFNVRVKGDVKVVFYDHDKFSAPDKMLHFWWHTGFVDANYLLLHKEVLDRACKDKACKEFEPEFKLELFMERVDVEEPGEFDGLLYTLPPVGSSGTPAARGKGAAASSKSGRYLEDDNDEDMEDDDDDK